jgi:hypothetical protein
MSDTQKSPQDRIHLFKISNLHAIYVGGNPAVWDAEINRLRQGILSGNKLKLTEYQKLSMPHLFVDELITTVEQFSKLIEALESNWSSSAPVKAPSPEEKARSQKLAGIQPAAESNDKDDLQTKAQKPNENEGTQSSNKSEGGI